MIRRLLANLWAAGLQKLPSHLPPPIRKRPCQGRYWKRTFPRAQKNEIREFLTLFTECFGFSKNNQLQFHPNDEIMAIYKMLYPDNRIISGIDQCELEMLVQCVQERYGVALEAIWHPQLTLGELFDSAGHRRLFSLTYR